MRGWLRFGCAFQRTAKLVLRIAFRKKLYASIEAVQADLDEWIRSYNERAVAAMTSGQPIWCGRTIGCLAQRVAHLAVPVFFWPHKAGIIAVN